MASSVECIFFLIETEAEDSPGIDFDENQYDLKKKIYGTIIKIIINKWWHPHIVNVLSSQNVSSFFI